MKKLLKVIAVLAAVIVIAVASLVTYVKFALPDVGDAPELTIEATPQRLERGKYLVNNVMACLHCHSTMDHNTFGKLPISGTEGGGGEIFSQEAGFPGTFYAKNITPAALGEWTDGEILRAMTCGVRKDGSPLFNLMPYMQYGKLDQEDIYSVIAYIRTIKPIENKVPGSEPGFPVSILINTLPQKAEFSKRPSKGDTVAYGKYLVTAAACRDCHTPMEKGQYIEEMYLAGGFKFPLKTGGTTQSANITPHKTSGIGAWSEEDFVARFKQYADSNYVAPTINPGEFNTEMPWKIYSGMDTTDLIAIYRYLRTVQPIDHQVTKFVSN